MSPSSYPTIFWLRADGGVVQLCQKTASVGFGMAAVLLGMLYLLLQGLACCLASKDANCA